MRSKPVARRGNAAPRYERIEAEEAARHEARQDRIAAGARSQAARFFYERRQHLRLARGAVAYRVGTEIGVIEALETGDMARLPRWPDTVRVVHTYLQLVHMDPRPVLHALHIGYSHHLKREAQRGVWGRFADAWHAGTLTERVTNSARLIRPTGLQLAAAASLPAVLAASLLLSSGPQASSPPPQRVAAITGSVQQQDDVKVFQRDGFTWIEASNPRDRRGDKLQPARP